MRMAYSQLVLPIPSLLQYPHSFLLLHPYFPLQILSLEEGIQEVQQDTKVPPSYDQSGYDHLQNNNTKMISHSSWCPEEIG